MGKRIFVACPAYSHSGGPELLHQLCYSLRKQGFDSVMYYYEIKDTNESPVSKEYEKYSNPYVTRFDDDLNSLIVIPETGIWLLKKIKKAQKIFWWLSVDNYYVSTARSFGQKLGLTRQQAYSIKERLHLIDCTRYIQDHRVIHLVQSEYAKEHLHKIGILRENIFYLSDYLNEEFILHKRDISEKEKEDIVLYNPRKGLNFTKKIIKAMPDIKFVPLQGLSRDEMVDIIKRAKCYIDFGNHPGKDRIPREAAILGCCIITDTEGAAGNDIDVPIKKEYKFIRENENIINITRKIRDCLSSYHGRINDFKQYQEKICQEEKEFHSAVKTIFSKLCNLPL